MGDPNGRPVLLVGVIHGNEAKGFGITQLIRTMPTPPGIDLWIIDSINPDGQAANSRYNANGVDLNRNVSYNWNYIPKTTDDGAVLRRRSRRSARDPSARGVHQRDPTAHHDLLASGCQPCLRRVEPALIPRTFAEIVGLSTASTPCTGWLHGHRDPIRQSRGQRRHRFHRRTTRQRRGDAGDDRPARQGDARSHHALTRASVGATFRLPAHRPLHVALRVALGHRVALVGLASATGQRQLDFDPAALEVERRAAPAPAVLGPPRRRCVRSRGVQQQACAGDRDRVRRRRGRTGTAGCGCRRARSRR